MRLHSLDSLRGIAAATVVVHHCVLSLPNGAENREALMANGFADPWAWLYLTPLRLLVAGPVAVYIFFVLSGLVLAMTFVDRDGTRYLPYLIKRFTRIWIPFAAAIAISAGLARLVGHDTLADASPWFDFTWSEGSGRSILVDHLLMTGRHISLDNPMWSLIHELRISMIFPLLVLSARANWLASLAGSIIIGVIASRVMVAHPAMITSASLAQTATYLFMFVLGIGLAIHSRHVRHWLQRRGAWSRLALWSVALAGLAVAPAGTMVVTGRATILLTWLNAGAATLLIALCIVEGRALRFLSGPIPQFLGRISYSLYLTHVIVVVTVVRLVAPILPIWAGIAAGAALSLPIAALFWRLVEFPAGQFGRRLAARVTRR